MDIGERIKDLRTQHKLSQAQLSKYIGVSAGNVGDWERKRAKPGADALLELINFFNISADWLLTGKNNSPIATNELHLSTGQQALLEQFDLLTDTNQLRIIERIETLIDVQQDEKREKSSTCTNGNDELSATSEIIA